MSTRNLFKNNEIILCELDHAINYKTRIAYIKRLKNQ